MLKSECRSQTTVYKQSKKRTVVEVHLWVRKGTFDVPFFQLVSSFDPLRIDETKL